VTVQPVAIVAPESHAHEASCRTYGPFLTGRTGLGSISIRESLPDETIT
jgi:hypothetical protein